MQFGWQNQRPGTLPKTAVKVDDNFSAGLTLAATKLLSNMLRVADADQGHRHVFRIFKSKTM
jgi:hypothetical protein